jgi:hypothetical protein
MKCHAALPTRWDEFRAGRRTSARFAGVERVEAGAGVVVVSAPAWRVILNHNKAFGSLRRLFHASLPESEGAPAPVPGLDRPAPGLSD